MNESILCDLGYAMAQMCGIIQCHLPGGFNFEDAKDRAQRALDALERVEEALSRPHAHEADFDDLTQAQRSQVIRDAEARLEESG